MAQNTKPVNPQILQYQCWNRDSTTR